MALLHTLPGPMSHDVDRQVQDADDGMAGERGCRPPSMRCPFVPWVRRVVTVGMPAADVGRVEALVIGVLFLWVLVAFGVAVVIGRGIRLADARSTVEHTLTTADLPAGFTPEHGTSRR